MTSPVPQNGEPFLSPTPRTDLNSSEKIRSPWIAALCSVCCIGLGQFYNGRTWDSISIWICFLILFVLGIIFPGSGVILILIGIGGWVYGICNAFTVAGEVNKRANRVQQNQRTVLFSRPGICLARLFVCRVLDDKSPCVKQLIFVLW